MSSSDEETVGKTISLSSEDIDGSTTDDESDIVSILFELDIV